MKNLVALLLLSSAKADNFGKNDKGEYNNQSEYLKAKNELNEAEKKNKDTFDSINQKLTDSDFVMMASNQGVETTLDEKSMIAAADMTDEEAQCYLNRYPDVVQQYSLGNLNKAKLHWKQKGEKEKRIKTCDTGLTDAEASCYLDRYPDLVDLKSKPEPIAAAKKHYDDWGVYEGRQKFCAPRITDQQAQCYLDKYEDLQTKFGTEDDAWIQAKEHFYTTGFAEGRLFNCERGPIT